MADTPRIRNAREPLTWAMALKALLPFVLVLITLAVSWGVLNQQMERARADVQAVEVRADGHERVLWEIKVVLAEMRRDLAYIREQIEKKEN